MSSILAARLRSVRRQLNVDCLLPALPRWLEPPPFSLLLRRLMEGREGGVKGEAGGVWDDPAPFLSRR